MAIATYMKTKDPGQEPNLQGIAVVMVDDGLGNDDSTRELEVNYWPSLILEWTVAGVKAYVCAEALFAQGFYSDARAAAIAGIPSKDGRSWGQEWADQHPDPQEGLG